MKNEFTTVSINKQLVREEFRRLVMIDDELCFEAFFTGYVHAIKTIMLPDMKVVIYDGVKIYNPTER